MEVSERLAELKLKMETADNRYIEAINRGHAVVATLSKLSPKDVQGYCAKMLEAMSFASRGQLDYSQIETNAKTILDMSKSIAFLEGKEKLEEYQLKDSATGRERLINTNLIVQEASNIHGEAEAKAIFCRDNYQIYKSALESAKKIIDLEKNFAQ